MITKDKPCPTCVERIRAIINDLMLADYTDGNPDGNGNLPPAVAKAVSDLLSMLPPIKEDDDES
mgnify:CR=1 FL=1